jgi:carbon storage regulator
MLVLSRKSGESIQIGENITLKVIECRRGRVRLGIEAPKDIDISRGELAACREQWRGRPADSQTRLKLTCS